MRKKQSIHSDIFMEIYLLQGLLKEYLKRIHWKKLPNLKTGKSVKVKTRRHAATFTGRSPFTAYFQQAMQEVKEQVAGEETWLAKEDNPYYCPGIITVLFDTYLAIFPLWSGLLLGDLSRYESHEQDLVTTKKQPKTRDTNCHVEKWFGIVKHSIMEKGGGKKTGTFIRKMHQSLQGRYTENIIQHKLPQKLLLQPEPPETPVNLDLSQETWMKTNLPQKPLLQPEPPETPVNLDQSKETWMKTNQERFPSTKSKFYSVPQKIPVPKKRRLDVDMLWKKPPTELIVAVLRSPRQKNESLLHHRELQSLRPHEWLNGEIIAWYIRALLQMKGANLYLLDYFTTGVILNETREWILKTKLKKVIFEEYDGLITFVNINNNHWSFVYLHAKCDTIFILDSQMGTNEKEKAKEICNKFRHFFKMRPHTDKETDWANKNWTPGTITHPFQEDSSSCGVFVMLMAKQVVEEFPKIPNIINITPSTEMMSHYRKSVAKEILMASGIKHFEQTV
ncbi:hypothetical protein G5714_004520 [Onychostoma macrolepis]|uniref:Ubiquitin-like protease family profile domain-containing protein n=1 Tax=Onychostoma macrolepis TaxID=369639 RepID=A0A7J6D4Z5_9TELE|nr:hypothetical protein G5714_004520 [Onychostoma macrolepis]